MTRPDETAKPGAWEPRIIAFLCYWCSYTGADDAGTARLKYPANIDIIRVMCSGRIDPDLIMTAFAKGADGVMVCGCHIGDCHYIAGNHKTMARMPIVARVLGDFGIEPERYVHEWVSAAGATSSRAWSARSPSRSARPARSTGPRACGSAAWGTDGRQVGMVPSWLPTHPGKRSGSPKKRCFGLHSDRKAWLLRSGQSDQTLS